jgi:hypothetical protein
MTGESTAALCYVRPLIVRQEAAYFGSLGFLGSISALSLMTASPLDPCLCARIYFDDGYFGKRWPQPIRDMLPCWANRKNSV